MTSPSTRLERLSVLTGGCSPASQFEIPEVYLNTDNAKTPRVISFSDPHSIGDLVFTDLGLLVVTYADFPFSGDIAKLGMSLMSGVHGLALGISEGLQRNRALNVYKELAPQEQSLAPTERFEKRGSFLPADEITNLGLVGNVLQFTFRDRLYTIAAATISKITLDEFQTWLSAARDKCRLQAGGPENAGIHALLEWSLRTTDSQPKWVASAIDALARSDTWNISDRGLFEDPAATHLLKRLLEFKSETATTLAKQLSNKMLKKWETYALVCSLLSVGSLVLVGYGVYRIVTESSISTRWGESFAFCGALFFLSSTGGVIYTLFKKNRLKRLMSISV